MKNRRPIDKDKVIFYIVLILIAALSIWGLIYKIKKDKMIKEWENQVEEPNTAEDYASDVESEFIVDSYDKYIFTGRIDIWPKRIYCFECTADGEETLYETEELLPIRMEVGDLVKIDGGLEGFYDSGFIITYIDSIKFVNEEVYIASIPEIKRVDKDYILHPTTRKVVDPYGNDPGSVVTGVPYDYIYYYYEDTGEVIAYFKNFITIDENEVMEIDEEDMADVSGYNYVKKAGKIYKYEDAICDIKDGKEERYYINIDIPEEETDKVLKRQRNEDVFFKYIIDPDILNGEG